MKKFGAALQKVLWVITAVIAGVCLFAMLLVVNTNRTVFNPDFHKSLFEQNNLYSEMHTVLNSSMSSYVNELKKNSPGDFDQYARVFSILENSLTPDMVKTNLDSMREGLFQYFSGKRMFLPDIYLNPGVQEKAQVLNTSPTPTDALAKIDKVNLSAILLYINRSDISDTFFELKFIYYMSGSLPGFLMLGMVLILLLGVMMCRTSIHYRRWGSIFLAAAGFLSLISGFGLLWYNHYLLPQNIYPLTMSIPLRSGVILSYIHDCILPLASSMMILGMLLLLLALALLYLPLLLKRIIRRTNTDTTISEISASGRFNPNTVKNLVCAFLCLLVVTSAVYRVNGVKNDFEENDFSTAVAKLMDSNTVKEVIAAKNDSIYGLNVKLVDSKTKEPIVNTKIGISGKSAEQNKNFNESITTDSEGVARFTLDKGTFQMSFFSNHFPTNYQVPSPFFFDMKSAGTTIITVNLDVIPDDAKPKWGIVEMELLDKDNKPVPNVELTVESPVFAPGYPNSIYSYSNEDGIALFKLFEGNYKIGFVGAKVPPQFKLPPSVDVNVQFNAVNRYTIRLVDAH